MTPFSVPPSVPFFLPTASGQRFCIYHAPPASTGIRAAVLYAHPFAEEMNRSRRIVALQARALAASDVAVLQIDLHGCGDSSGDFADACWQTWKDDCALAHDWLVRETKMPVSLWGLRLGALLMLDYATAPMHPVDHLVLWQPITSGQVALTQWLRLRLANHMFNNEGSDEQTQSMQGLRAQLAQGQSLEVAGYELSPALAAAIDALDAIHLAPVGCTMDWFDIAPNPGKPMSPATDKVVTHWQQHDVQTRYHAIAGQAFWALPEITDAPALIDATLAVFNVPAFGSADSSVTASSVTASSLPTSSTLTSGTLTSSAPDSSLSASSPPSSSASSV